jgi:DNA-binding CsgD family transcriptional regulator
MFPMLALAPQDGIRAMARKTGNGNAPSPLVTILFRIFGAMSCGIILIDRDKRPLHLSDRAQGYLGGPLSVQNGHLCATDRTCNARLQIILDQSLKYGESQKHWRREALGLKRDRGRAVIVRIVPVEDEARDLLDSAALVMILLDPEDSPKLSPGMLGQTFGLTNAEARVAARLVCGESVQDIAETTGISVETVRSQIKALMAKTQTHRQPELVGLLTRVAMISEAEAEMELTVLENNRGFLTNSRTQLTRSTTQVGLKISHTALAD